MGATEYSSGCGQTITDTDTWEQTTCIATGCLSYMFETTAGICTTKSVVGVCTIAGSADCDYFDSTHSSFTGYTCAECNSDECNPMSYTALASAASASPAPADEGEASTSAASPSPAPADEGEANAVAASPTPAAADEAEVSASAAKSVVLGTVIALLGIAHATI